MKIIISWSFLFACSLLSISAGPARAEVPVIGGVLDESALKPSIDPCDDFYRFSCGGFLDRTVIPSDKPLVYRGGSDLDDLTAMTFDHLLARYSGRKPGTSDVPPAVKAPSFPPKATYSAKLGDYYASCMNVASDAPKARKLLKAELRAISRISSARELAASVARLQRSGIGAIFSLQIYAGFHDSSINVAHVAQGGFSLPDRDYYLSQDEKFVGLRAKYLAHVGRVFELSGVSSKRAEAIAKSILAFETTLARNSYPLEDSYDPTKIDHWVSRAEIKAKASIFDWDTYFEGMDLGTLREMNLDEPEFFAGLQDLLVATPLADVKAYLEWQVLQASLSELGDKRFEAEYISFWKKDLHGQQTIPPRWKTCVRQAEGQLGYALAEAYVNLVDGQAIRDKANAYIDQIKSTFSDELDVLTHGEGAWLDPATQEQALLKLEKVGRKVGAPEHFRDYSRLSIDRKMPFLANSLAASRFEVERQLHQVGQKVDKSEWSMMPWEVNAYYDPANNEFVFPYGILQPPTFDIALSDGANLGAFGGGTIGHELTHGYDKDGSQMDASGQLRDWWTPAVRKQFETKTQCYVEQANKYVVAEVGMHVDGTTTITENIADQGGVKLGYLALERLLSTRPEGEKWLGKYSERQQYWISYGQSWCMKYTPEALRDRMTSDVHPPSEFRVNGVVQNRPEFARDFGCAAGSRMAPADRCSLW